MEKKVCFLCDGNFTFEKWYGKCEHCKILRPESKERMLKEMYGIASLQKVISDHLCDLEQKHIYTPNKMTTQEVKERELWVKHNDLYSELMMLVKHYDVKNVRQQEIYPRLYSYVSLVEQIKKLYR